MRANILYVIKNLIEDFVGAEAVGITETTELVSQGYDDLDLAELALSLEDRFGLAISDASLISFITFGDIVSYVEEHRTDI